MCVCENELNVVVKAVGAAAHEGQPLSVMYQDVQMLVHSSGLFSCPLLQSFARPLLFYAKNTQSRCGGWFTKQNNMNYTVKQEKKSNLIRGAS